MKPTIRIITHDKELDRLNKIEELRQYYTLDLIASENHPSPAVRIALASVAANKYAEGYAGARYYPGCDEMIDPLERLVQKRALKAMHVSPKEWAVNVQALSGTPANVEVLLALVKWVGHKDGPDTVLGMALPAGGHLSHGHPVSATGKLFKFVQYGLDENGVIDYAQVDRLAAEHKPRLIVCGASSYSRMVDFARFGEIAKKHGALLMADIAHIAGLVAGGAHPSPFPHCDAVTTTTHKTFRGPRHALIFARKELMASIDTSVFPRMQGGSHYNTIFGVAVALGEMLKPAFRTYAKQVVKNAAALASALQARGYALVSGKTENHLFMLDLRPQNITGLEAQNILHRVGIDANRNAIPNDPRGPKDPSGIRMGTPALTTRGIKEKEMRMVADFIDCALKDSSPKNLARIKKQVKALCEKFPPPGF